ncbi:PA0069 family radical SAM protein [Pelagicoccus sp. SDUM812003]|uniref:PA0069 family radical SAM protein n=1 Tax=Pelagicoccus sp. SDUM812003 TaxID=3041267 RepID=UPI00280D962D|nr:PA0069 family radical SAM protein [Pelagicoccus sp. SDUM812003]MDQ8202677.1 PA0069 family radical SAM protein [Pelagicoccus sp. SDUM812003]
MDAPARSLRGRGASTNPANRFEPFLVERVETGLQDDEPALTTTFYEDASESIISYNSSPDIPFDASVNPYRGCEHGCSYCYARPFHEYLGFSAGLDFETKIMVKRRAAALLKEELSSSMWRPQLVAMSGVTDPYQPIEKRFGLTRACLQVLLDFRNPVGVVTKNRLAARDLEIYGELARRDLCHVTVSLNSLDAELARKMEPRTSSPKGRLEMISAFASMEVPVGILIAPVIPGLNDHEIPAILKAAKQAGASYASYILLRLPLGVKDIFFDWVERLYPSKRQRIEDRLRDLRDGQLNRSTFGERFRGSGIFADQIRQLFEVSRRKAGLAAGPPDLSVADFRRPLSPQLELGL